jgi:hypothetical protein
MRGKDPVAVMEAASAEISYARRLHREVTKESDFRKGSRGREYCENLQKMISMLMNGSIPVGSSPEFLITVNPLIQELLQRWEIGSLRQEFSDIRVQDISLPDSIDPIVIVISREEVEAMDTSLALANLTNFTKSRNTAMGFVERVDVAFFGYDHKREELFEIPAVRNVVYQLDEQFPYWLYFLSIRYLGFQSLLLCFLPPFLTDEARSKIFPERINDLLTKRWFPAMNHMCEYVGFSESQIEQLTERALAYITKGRFPIDSEPFA